MTNGELERHCGRKTVLEQQFLFRGCTDLQATPVEVGLVAEEEVLPRSVRCLSLQRVSLYFEFIAGPVGLDVDHETSVDHEGRGVGRERHPDLGLFSGREFEEMRSHLKVIAVVGGKFQRYLQRYVPCVFEGNLSGHGLPLAARQRESLQGTRDMESGHTHCHSDGNTTENSSSIGPFDRYVHLCLDLFR